MAILNSVADLAYFCRPPRSPSRYTTSSMLFVLPSAVCYDVATAAALLVTGTDDASVCLLCASVCVSGVCAVIHSNTKRSRRAVRITFHKQPLNLAATKTVYRSTAAAVHRQPVVLQALDFGPVVTVNGCMVDAQQQEMEPRHDTFSSPTQQPNTHRQTPHTRYTNLYSRKKQ